MIDDHINGDVFTLYIEKVFAPTLAPVEIVVLDNLGGHMGKAARQAIGARPPYLLAALQP